MELSGSTFLFEIINFLVLVWILKHFLYRPVLDIIEQRRNAIDSQLTEARDLKEQAQALRSQYENRLADWELELQQRRTVHAREFESERSRQLEALHAEMAREREKALVADSRRQEARGHEAEQRALQLGARFASNLLAGACTPELEKQLVDIAIEGLAKLSGEQVTALRTQCGERPQTILAASAFPLSKQQRSRLENTLREVTTLDLPLTYTQAPELLAGLQITIGAWTLQCNVGDELNGFTRFAHAL